MSQNLFPDGPEPASINGVEGPSAFVNADSRTGVVGGKPSMTVDQAASQLLRGEPGWSAALGVPATVTYAFRATAPTKMPSDTSGFSNLGCNSESLAYGGFELFHWKPLELGGD